MRTSYKKSLLLLSGFLIFMQDVAAAPPIAFDGFTDNSGSISAPCPASFTCVVGVSDIGILQRTLRASNGDEFTQLIVTGTDLQGTTFVDESFIQMNSGLSGISLQQTIIDGIGVDQLSARTILNTGWANTAGPAIDITQSVTSGGQGSVYSDSFAYSLDLDTNGNVIGSYSDISQTLTDAATFNSITSTGTDVQRFVARRASGTRNPNAGSANLGGAMGGQNGMMGQGGMGGQGQGQGGMMGGGGGALNWNAGDDLQIVWIGSLCDGCGNGGGMGGGGMGGGGMGGGGMGGGGGGFGANFSYEKIDNLSDAISPIMTASIIGTNPFIWPDPPFGVAPVGP